MPIADISRSNYLLPAQQDTLRITPFSRKLRDPLAQDVTKVVDLRPRLRPGDHHRSYTAHASGLRASALSLADSVLQINIPPSDPVDYQKVRKAASASGPSSGASWPKAAIELNRLLSFCVLVLR